MDEPGLERETSEGKPVQASVRYMVIHTWVQATPFTKFFDGTTRVLGSERATRADDAAALDVSELELGDLVVVEALIGRYWTTKKGEPGSPSKDTSGGKNKFMSNANLILFGLHLLKKHEAYIEAPVTAKVSSSEGWGDL